jgi:hypothetical protein
MVAQKTFTAGEVLTAANTNTYLRGGQEMGYAEITAASSAFTSVADISGLSLTWTAISTRSYYLMFDGQVASSVAGDRISVYITDGSGTQVTGRTAIVSSVSDVGLTVACRLTGLSGSVTYKVRAQRLSGSGTTTISASATVPAFFSVLDVGAA